MNTGEYEEINRRYDKKDKSVTKKFLLGLALGSGLVFSSFIVSPLTASRSRPFETYNSAMQTLEVIKKERGVFDKITYKPEHIRSYLYNAFTEERRESLDTAIELIGKDIENMKNSKDYLADEKAKNRSNLIYGVLVLGGFSVMIGNFLYSINSQKRNKRKRDEELYSLQGER